jgi:tRNA pseudouridine38-40 synthase
MRPLKLTLQYDGTNYVGWQRQANGVSVQQRVEEALQEVEGVPVTVTGAGRTDAGVHALGQVASFRLEHPIDVASLYRALNARLPEDIRVTGVEEAPADFHARFSARAKTYRYRIFNGPQISPFERHYAWHVPHALDCAAMAAAARILEGRHDFAAFQAAGGDVRTTERTLFAVKLRKTAGAPGPFDAAAQAASASGELLVLDFCGDGFLRHMVRTVVGTLVEVGTGRRDVASVRELLTSGDRRLAGPTAPARGLFLVSVEY